MNVINLSNYFNHHQKPLADEMFRLLGDGYHFIETTEIPEFRKKLGYQESHAPYVLKYNEQTRDWIDKMIIEADAVIYGEAPLSLIKKRYNAGKLTFRDDESRYKNPNRYLKWPIYTYKSHWLNKGYLLCSSAFAPVDYFLSGMKLSRCYKWGYFTELKRYDINLLMAQKRMSAPKGVSILWAGRLIGLKHPEAAIKVADYLKRKGLPFHLDIIGGGELENELKQVVMDKGLESEIDFLGPMTPPEVRRHMEHADIYLFTSDRQEGWGAVLNESMNSGCAVVADGNIGSVPYLIDDGSNGVIYKSTNWKDLCEKVEYLVRNPDTISKLGRRAYYTMTMTWNAETAARNFLALCNSLLSRKSNPVIVGPCSNSPFLTRKMKGMYNTL